MPRSSRLIVAYFILRSGSIQKEFGFHSILTEHELQEWKWKPYRPEELWLRVFTVKETFSESRYNM